MTDATSSTMPGQIVIARHGEPDADRYARMDWRGYERWWAAYDEAGLRPGQSAPEALGRRDGQRAQDFRLDPAARH
jgi:hypothetical protein